MKLLELVSVNERLSELMTELNGLESFYLKIQARPGFHSKRLTSYHTFQAAQRVSRRLGLCSDYSYFCFGIMTRSYSSNYLYRTLSYISGQIEDLKADLIDLNLSVSRNEQGWS